MLTPEYLWSAADVVVNTYDEMNNWAIRDIAERIMAAELYGDKLPGTARYRAWMMNQSGMHYEEMSKKLAEITKKAEPDIMKLFIEAGLTSVANDYAPFGMEPYDITKDKVATQILESVYKKTKGELHNYTRTTLDQSNKLFIDVLDKAFYEIAYGMRSYNEVIQEAIETVSKEGCTVKYPSGHVDKQEVAVRRAVMTGVSQASSQITLHNCEVLDTDYVIITAHSGARHSATDKIANHIGWQGGVYKLHGVSSEKSEDVDKIIKYNQQRGIQFQGDVIPNLEEETGFPNNPLGLCGYNCRHNIRAFQIEYMNPYTVNPEIDEEKSNREYDFMQKQRAKERSIRDTRRELIGLDAAIENCKDEETKFNLQMNYDKTAKKLERQTDAYNQFCDENNLTRDYNRMQTARFDRDQAYKATRGAKRYNAISKNQLSTSRSDSSHIATREYVGNIEGHEKIDMIKKLESGIRDEKYENAYVIQKNGDMYKFVGGEDYVNIFDVDFDGAVVTHNHPASNGIVSFGHDDFQFLKSHQELSEFRVVNEEYTYYVRVLKNLDDVVYNDIYISGFDHIRSESNIDVQHCAFLELKKRGYVEYVRQKLKKD